MPIYKFQSTDTGAPTLSGTVGHAINVLDACLVNGFGSAAVSTMTRSGSVVTVTTSSPHGFYYAGQSVTETASVARISGAVETAYNGDWKVATVTSTTVFTFNIGVATPTSPATGTITSLRAPLGWAKSFSGTNKAAYRMPVGTAQHYLRVDDNAPTGGDAKVAAIRGYETMSDVDTGTGLFPTVVQIPNGTALAKSDTASTATRPWILISDGEFIWLGVSGANTVNRHWTFFGGSATFKAGDAYPTLISAAAVSTTFTVANAGLGPAMASVGFYIARTYTQLGSSIVGTAVGDNGFSTNWGNGGLAFPSPVDNGLYFSRVRFYEVVGTVLRGMLPGILQPLHTQPLASGDTVENIVGLAGATVQGWTLQAGATTNGEVAFDLTGPWR